MDYVLIIAFFIVTEGAFSYHQKATLVKQWMRERNEMKWDWVEATKRLSNYGGERERTEWWSKVILIPSTWYNRGKGR